MKQLQLNLGCWKRYIPGFIHIDQADFPHIDYKTSIDKLYMFSDETVDLIYCSHALEYFDRQTAKTVLKEWYRVLKNNGILRLAVPDFEALIKVYEQYGDLSKILGPLFGRMEILTPEPKLIFHKTVYDFTSLKNLLESENFSEIKRYDWRNTIHKDYDDHSHAYIPHMDKENGLLISLNVEARKA
jgi:predicted SAM-dependent methyltransferase